MKSIFARHGRPNVLKTDNGPQFASEEVARFAKEWGFTHVTSSPLYPKANGLSESGLKIIKDVMRCPGDPQRGLLAFRAAPNDTGYSPGQLLMSRQLRTSLPSPAQLFQPEVPDIEEHQNKLRQRQRRAADAHDARHRASELPVIRVGARIWVSDRQAYGIVIALCPEPCSYQVEMQDGGIIRRNRMFLRLISATDAAVPLHPPFLPEENAAVESETRTPTRAPPLEGTPPPMSSVIADYRGEDRDLPRTDAARDNNPPPRSRLCDDRSAHVIPGTVGCQIVLRNIDLSLLIPNKVAIHYSFDFIC